MMNEEIGQQKETAQETIRVDDKDYLIQMFVHLANEGIQTDITLMLGGSVITGTVIGGKQYLDELAKLYSGAGGNADDGTKKSISEGLVDMKSLYDNLDSNSPPPSFIHLKNIQVFNGTNNGILNSETSLWRGKLSSVDAFVPGRFSLR